MKRTISLTTLLFIALAAACSREQTQQAKTQVQQKVKKIHEAFEADTPYGKDDPNAAQQREQARFDQRWRDLQSFKAQQEAAAAAAQQQQQQQQQQAPPEQQIAFAPPGTKKETFKHLDANAIDAAPVLVPITGDVKGPSVLKAQVYLDRLHFSVGALDGRWGRNSAISVWWWQRANSIPATGDVDETTFRALARAAGYAKPLTTYTITADDTKGPFVHIPDDPYEKAKLDCLCYETVREELAEKFHCSEDFLDLLNPDVKYEAGTTINVPNVREATAQDTHDIAKVTISISGNSWSGFDASGRLVFHAPSTLGSTYDPSPSETLKVVKITRNPHFHYDPTLYHEVPDSEPDAMMSPGPNSPVGVVWMALSKQHYGMHGTPDPESIGYASSHGCVRLTNWDADEVSHRISEGTQVSFVDPTSKGLPDVAKKSSR